MIRELLKERNIPELLDRDSMLSLLLEEVYGKMPPRPEKLMFEMEDNVIPNFCAGKATLAKVTAKCELFGQTFSFPFSCVLPTQNEKHPFFIHINFRGNVPDIYEPTEELVDHGFAVLSFNYNDVTKDNDDFTDGLAGILYNNTSREKDSPGKIAMWAWAAQRIMDFAQTLDKLDLNRSIVCGHSRLGKTALLAGATDERFSFVYSNNSGCSGAAITRDKNGETVKDICKVFPYWFCENYKKYMENEYLMPFDQHYLLASIAPRYVCVGSATKDQWADPVSEFLGCAAASPAFEAHGLTGFISEDRLPVSGDTFFEGTAGYHLREGAHYFSRADWLKLIDYINAKEE